MNQQNRLLQALRNDAFLENQISLASIVMVNNNDLMREFLQDVLSCALADSCSFLTFQSDSYQENFARSLLSINESYEQTVLGIDFGSAISNVLQYYKAIDDEYDEYDEYDELSDEEALELFVNKCLSDAELTFDEVGVSDVFHQFMQLSDLWVLSENLPAPEYILRESRGYQIGGDGYSITLDKLDSNGEHINLYFRDLHAEDVYLELEHNHISSISLAENKKISLSEYDVDIKDVLSVTPLQLMKDVVIPTESLIFYFKAFAKYLSENNRMTLQAAAWARNAMNEIIDNDGLLDLFVATIAAENVEDVFEVVASTYPIDVTQKYLKAQIINLGDEILQPDLRSLLYYSTDIDFILNSSNASAEVKELAQSSRLKTGSLPSLLLEQTHLDIEEINYACRL